jgi:hypothetical protein
MVFSVAAVAVRAQDSTSGPLTSAPPRPVVRITNQPEPEAPPSVPEDQIIKHFSQKEDEYAAARAHYTYKKTIRIESFGPDGQPSGDYVMVTQGAAKPDGTLYEKAVQRPQSTLPGMHLMGEDLNVLERVPLYPLTTAQLPKYNLKYIGKEKVDEVDCYLIQVKPKTVSRETALFDGVVWVDDKHLEIVKSYGQWMTDLGPLKTETLPFALFETYREYVDDKFWFPTYMRSDTIAKVDNAQIPLRVVIKYSDFKPLGTPTAAAPATPQPTSSQPPKP